MQASGQGEGRTKGLNMGLPGLSRITSGRVGGKDGMNEGDPQRRCGCQAVAPISQGSGTRTTNVERG